MKILVLHSRLSGYWMACMQTFVDEYGGNITVIHQKASPNAPFEFSSTDNISLYTFDSFTEDQLKDFCIEQNPDLVYISGWFERVYLTVAKYFYTKDIPVLCGMDNQWKNSLKQKAGFLYLKYRLANKFTHIWIPGIYQIEAAQKLGFPRERILTGLYSANVPLFSKVVKRNNAKTFPKSFIFLGRLVSHKGLKELALAFNRLKEQTESEWSLTVAGNGSLKEKIRQFTHIDLVDFVQPQKLPELMKEQGVFVLPSIIEPWGVVIHEAAAAGLPIISTYQCGAATAFIRNGYNGYLTEAGNVESLYSAMKQITQKKSSELYKMGKRSSELSLQYTPESWASTLFQLIKS